MGQKQRKKEVKFLLNSLDMSQKALAELLGMSRQNLNFHFNREKDISEELYTKIMEALQPKLKDVTIGENYIEGNIEFRNKGDAQMGDHKENISLKLRVTKLKKRINQLIDEKDTLQGEIDQLR